MIQTCTRCGESKQEVEYYLRNDGRRRSLCKLCYSVHNREMRVKHKDKRDAYDAERGSGWDRHPEGREKYAQNDEQRFKSYIKRQYDLEWSDYLELAEKQAGLCAICGKPDENRPRLSIDHDHYSGRVRGLLCFPCNTGIGKLQDNYDLVQAAADYLKGAQS